MIEHLALSFGLVLARVATFVALVPLLGGGNLPRTVKTGLALVLALVWFLPLLEGTGPGSLALPAGPTPWLTYGLALGREAALGALLGYGFGLFLVPAHVAGEFLTQELGLSFASQVSPAGDNPAGALTQVFEMLASAAFFALDGHHAFLLGLDATFHHYPLGGSLAAAPVEGLVAGLTATEEWGLVLAAPVAVCLWVTTVVLVLMARVVPQMNLYAVGFPLRVGAGLAAGLVLLPGWVAGTVSVFGRFGEILARLVEFMADDLDQQRTEAPTPRRREEARQQGQVAFSSELLGGAILLAGTAALTVGAGALGSGLLERTRRALIGSHVPDPSPQQAQGLLAGLFDSGLELVGPLVGVLFAVALGGGVLQAGWHLVPGLLGFNWAKLSPAAGAGRLVSAAAGVRGLLAVLKVLVVAVVAWWVLRERMQYVAGLNEATLAVAVAAAWGVVVRLALAVAAALALIGVVDYAYQRWRLEQSLRMSKQELKEEVKRDEGDPAIKARVRRLQREAAQKRMMREVPRATVVITNPTHLAIALRYDRATMTAPRVVAKGAGFVARRIAELARRHAVPVVERKPVAQALYKAVKIDQEIPAELYHAIAEILAYVYKLRAS